MTPPILIGSVITLGTVILMEGVAYAVHRFVMHGFGWSLHRSHHLPRTGFFEANDAYSLIFAALSVTFILCSTSHEAAYWVGIGMGIYGLLYALLHDGLIHRRFQFVRAPRRGYLLRLIKAHHIHHAVRTRDGAVSFGFLYAPPVQALTKRVSRREQD